MRLGRKKKTGHTVSYGLEIDGSAVYSVRCVDGVITDSREYHDLPTTAAIAQALKGTDGKSKIAIAINGPVDVKETLLRSMAAPNPVVLKALIKNAASTEMGDVAYTAARRIPSDDPFLVKVVLMGMIGASEIDALFSHLGAKQCFTTPVQGVSQSDGVHLHMGRKGAALYFVEGGATRRSSFVDSCRFEGFSAGPDGQGSAEEKAQRVADYLRRLTNSVSQDLTGWRRNDPAIPNRIFAHGAGAALSSVVVQSFALREIEVEVLGGADSGGPGPEFAIAQLAALDDTSDDIRSFTNPAWESKRLEHIHASESRTRAVRIGAMTCGVLALTVVPTVAAGIAKNRTASDITTQGTELAKYQPILAMYKSVSSETAPIRTAEAGAPDWTKVWQFLQSTQPSGAIVTNLEMTEGTPGVVTVDFSAEIPSQKPFAPIVAWINAMKSHGAISVQTSTMTYSANNGIQTTSFSLQLSVGSATGVKAPVKAGSAGGQGGQS